MGILRNLFGNRSSDLADFIRSGAVIIDVRTTEEFKEGHIRGSRNVPIDALMDRLEEIRRLNKPVVTVCKSGTRSSTAKAFLEGSGIKAVNGGSWADLNAVMR